MKTSLESPRVCDAITCRLRGPVAGELQRSSGVLLHLTVASRSFRRRRTLVRKAAVFADALADARQRVWCILSVWPAWTFNSPYQSCSAFAAAFC